MPGLPLPDHLETLDGPLIIGLTNDPNVLVQIRRNRLRMLNETRNTEYIDPEAVKAEVAAARRLFADRGWPVLDVSRRSIEETAPAIMQMVAERRGKQAKKTA